MNGCSFVGWCLLVTLLLFRVAFFIGLLYVSYVVVKGVLRIGRPVEVEAAGGAVPDLRETGSVD